MVSPSLPKSRMDGSSLPPVSFQLSLCKIQIFCFVFYVPLVVHSRCSINIQLKCSSPGLPWSGWCLINIIVILGTSWKNWAQTKGTWNSLDRTCMMNCSRNLAVFLGCHRLRQFVRSGTWILGINQYTSQCYKNHFCASCNKWEKSYTLHWAMLLN